MAALFFESINNPLNHLLSEKNQLIDKTVNLATLKLKFAFFWMCGYRVFNRCGHGTRHGTASNCFGSISSEKFPKFVFSALPSKSKYLQMRRQVCKIRRIKIFPLIEFIELSIVKFK